MTTQQDKKFDLEDRLVDFAVRVIRVVEALPEARAAKHIAGQLVRSGTSPAPNYGEAQAAESRKDFIHKMKVALKELRETNVWLKIIERAGYCDAERMCDLKSECNQLIAIFVKSVETANKNLTKEEAEKYCVGGEILTESEVMELSAWKISNIKQGILNDDLS